MQIYKTEDYSIFKFFDRNRDVKPVPRKLVKSILKRNLLHACPIKCDKNMYVLDGQNRLMAAKHLQIPIYYSIYKELTVDDISFLNVQNPWSLEEFLKFYSTVNDDYAFIKQIMDQFVMPLSVILQCMGKGVISEFKIGKLRFKKRRDETWSAFQKLNDIMRMINKIKLECGRSKQKVTFKIYLAMWDIINLDGYDQNNMLAKLHRYPDNIIPILDYSREELIKESILARVYNFNSKKNILKL